jgi:two-component system chemotaxis response regulator CheY
MQSNARTVEAVIQSLKVLVVDDEPFMRRVVQGLLATIGIRDVVEAGDGAAGLEVLRKLAPDLVILDWNMPGMNGAAVMQAVRAPGTFPYPDVPVIVLTGNSERGHVAEAVRAGVHEYLIKPVSTKALRDSIVSIVTKPRPMLKRGDYYGPEPRRLSAYKPEDQSGYASVVLVN